jgi:hypothetical protein
MVKNYKHITVGLSQSSNAQNKQKVIEHFCISALIKKLSQETRYLDWVDKSFDYAKADRKISENKLLDYSDSTYN